MCPDTTSPHHFNSMTDTKHETPRQALNKEIELFRTRQQLLKAIASTAQPVEQGYVISSELMESVKKFILD